jgi:3-demethoxyubiquinol 3-hydroxylase
MDQNHPPAGRPLSPSNSPLDRLIVATDNALRALFAPPQAGRAVRGLPEAPKLAEIERRHAAGLMRVNHAGEIAAQALYHGQAFLARDAATRAFMLNAAREEGDHLAWCETRLQELHSAPSKLNPLWYGGSFAIGAAAALFGDRVSLGFVTETERQVEGHLAEHLKQLPEGDIRSRRIVEVMQQDEAAHADSALRAGASELKEPVRQLMRLTSQVMTRCAYWL